MNMQFDVDSIDISTMGPIYKISYDTLTGTLCVLVYQCVRGSAPSYLQNAICPVASAESRRRLRSASSSDLIVPATRRTTMGADRAFAVAAPRACTVCRTRSVAAHLWLSSNVH